jgi:hypothetical protein
MVSQGVLLYFSKDLLDDDATLERKVKAAVSESGESNEDQVPERGSML